MGITSYWKECKECGIVFFSDNRNRKKCDKHMSVKKYKTIEQSNKNWLVKKKCKNSFDHPWHF